jgi:four helix bundle protein
VRFLEIAFGSLRELHYQVSLSKRLGYLDGTVFEKCDAHIFEAEKVLGALVRAMRKKPEFK